MAYDATSVTIGNATKKADFDQLLANDAYLKELIDNGLYTDGGTGDVRTITAVPAITAYAAGLKYWIKSSAANTTAVTLEVNGKGAVAIKKHYNQALTANDIKSGAIYLVEHDGTNFQLLSPSSNTTGTGAEVMADSPSFSTKVTMGTDCGLNETITTVASHATTAPIWAATGNVIDYTGTETATAFPNAPQAGMRRTLICAAASKFTAGANMLIDGIISGDTYTAAAGDKVHITAVTTSQFRLTMNKYDGTPVKSTGLVSASQAEMEAATITTAAATPGNTNWHPGVAKAWLCTNGTTTPAIAASHNITSVTDTNIGRLTVTIATDFSSADYVIVSGPYMDSQANYYLFTTAQETGKVAGAFEVRCYTVDATIRDPVGYMIACFGDQA